MKPAGLGEEPRHRLRWTILAVALSLPSSLSAESYKVISSNKSQIILADGDGVVVRPKSVQLWAVTLRAPGQFLLGSVAIIKMLYEFDCSANASRYSVMTTYRKDYSLIENQYVKSEPWQPIVPDTQHSALKGFACGTQTFRNTRPSLGPFPLGKIIASVYAGPWPVQ